MDTEITIISVEERDYISLTDMANAKESESRTAGYLPVKIVQELYPLGAPDEMIESGIIITSELKQQVSLEK